MNVPPYIKEEIKEEADQRGLTQAQLCRMLIQMGLKFEEIYHPTEGDTQAVSRESHDLSPFVQLIPKGEENAIHIDEYVEKIEENIFDIINETDQITQDNWEVYR